MVMVFGSGFEVEDALKELSSADERLAKALSDVGYPRRRFSDGGFESLLRIIIGQQVSVAAANAIESRLRARYPALLPGDFAASSVEDLRRCGLSARKAEYAQGLSEAVLSGLLDLQGLALLSDEDVMARLVALRGFGRWSAENYCLFCLRRRDIFPADDLALRAGLQLYLGDSSRPTVSALRDYAERWRPYRSAAALFIWHYYGCKR